MNYQWASMYNQLPSDISNQLHHTIQSAIKASPHSTIQLYFRADDIGVPGSAFSQMMEMFKIHQTPLNLAVVPSWLTHARWKKLKRLQKDSNHLFCWHQHGWRHFNHESLGKKQEFGDNRSIMDIKRDLIKGRDRLTQIMGDDFFPFFTPPWNRCSQDCMDQLRELQFFGLSRDKGAAHLMTKGLIEIPIHADLHTRKESLPSKGWKNLFSELKNAFKKGRCGVMLHHQRMNKNAFEFLDLFLKDVKKEKNIRMMTFSEQVKKGGL